MESIVVVKCLTILAPGGCKTLIKYLKHTQKKIKVRKGWE